MEKKNDNFGQHYNTPDDLIIKMGIDIIIVGRSITTSKDRINGMLY